MTGHEIEAGTMERQEEDPMELHCPTPGCQSIPLDWILPSPRASEIRT